MITTILFLLVSLALTIQNIQIHYLRKDVERINVNEMFKKFKEECKNR